MFFSADLDLGNSHFRLKDHQICQQVHHAYQQKEIQDPEGEYDRRTDGLIELVVSFVLKVIRQHARIKYDQESGHGQTYVEGHHRNFGCPLVVRIKLRPHRVHEVEEQYCDADRHLAD